MLLSLLVASVLAADAPRNYDAWLESPKTLGLTDARSPEALAQLAHAYVTAVEPRRGVPSFLWAERFSDLRTPKSQGLTATEAARQHVLRYGLAYRLSALQVAQLVVSEVHDLGTGAVIVGFARAAEGLPFLRDELDVVMTHDYELVALTGSLATQGRPHGTFRLDAASALSTAAQHLTGHLVDSSQFKRLSPREGGWSLHATGGLFTSPPRARRVYFDDSDGVLPAWHLEVEQAGQLHALVISAVDGRLLSFVDLEASAAHTYRVFANAGAPFRPLDSPVGDVALPNPTGAPAPFDPARVSSSLVTLDNGGLSTNDPWLPAGATELSGNNIHAYADLVAPDGLDGGDFTVAPTSAAFDFTYDFAQPSNVNTSQHSASATQAFFVTNWMHDVFYDLGFNETARNGQKDNFARGGLGGDAVNVEVHDYNGRNNADMLTTADGQPSRLQLYLSDEGRSSTLTVTTSALADGGTFLGVPPAVPFARGWDVTGVVRSVDDLDGGHGGCDPWTNPAQYTGAIVLVDGDGCSVLSRFDAAKDAGVAALLLTTDGCGVLAENQLVAACVEADAGLKLLELAVAATPMSAHLVRSTSAPERDIAFDTTVVTHEYTHFITNRLIGDSLGLLNSPAAAMGEGWSDFVALWFSLRDTDASAPANTNWQGSFAIAGWSSGGFDFDGSVLPAHYFGVRRFPYSSDRAKNPLTFKHVGTNVPLPTTAPRQFTSVNNAEVHNAGEVWATMLWDVQTKLLTKPGATVDGARTTMGRYLVSSLKATPALPTFIEARDALLAVINAESPTVDFPLALDAFAQRGLGVLASSTDRRSTTNTPLAEDFTGAGGNYRLVSLTLDDTDDECDTDGILDTGETGTATVTLMNIGSQRLSRSVLSLSTPGSIFLVSAVGMAMPQSEPFHTTTLTLPVSMARGVLGLQALTIDVQVLDPDLALPQHRFTTSSQVRLNADLLPSTREDFEAGAPGWKFDGDGEFPWEDLWFVRTTSPTAHVLQGPDMRSAGTSSVTSPPLAVGAGAFSVIWSQAYTFENAMTFFDGGRLEISTDGTTFTPVPGSALTPTYSATLAASANPLTGQSAFGGVNTTRGDVTANFGTQYANRTVWLRWTIGADATGGASGWSVDEVRVVGLTTTPFTEVIAHRGMCVNHAPLVSGTSSINVVERTDVTLIPGATFDRDGDPLIITWMQMSGPSVQLMGDTFTAPEVTPAGAVLGFKVTVEDGRGGVDTDEMTVSVRNLNRPPSVVSTSGPQEVVAGQSVTLGVIGEDPDGDPLTFTWQQQGEATLSLMGSTTDTVTFIAPDVKERGLLSLKVVAIDGNTASEPSFVAVVLNPKPNSCACTSVDPLLGLGLALLLLRRKSRAKPIVTSPS